MRLRWRILSPFAGDAQPCISIQATMAHQSLTSNYSVEPPHPPPPWANPRANCPQSSSQISRRTPTVRAMPCVGGLSRLTLGHDRLLSQSTRKSCSNGAPRVQDSCRGSLGLIKELCPGTRDSARTARLATSTSRSLAASTNSSSPLAIQGNSRTMSSTSLTRTRTARSTSRSSSVPSASQVEGG